MLVYSRTSTGTTVTFDVTVSQAPGAPGSIPRSPSSGSQHPPLPRVVHLGFGPIGDDHHPEHAALKAKLRGLRCLVVDGRPVRQQVG